MVDIHYKLFDIYTLHIKVVDMNKKFNVIYELRNYRRRRRDKNKKKLYHSFKI